MKLMILFILNVSLFTSVSGQEIKDTIIVKELSSYAYEKPAKRNVLSFKNKSVFYKINPLTYVGAGLMLFYQGVISEQFSSDCAYEETCSQHTKHSIERHGFLKGIVLGFYQLQNCHLGTIYDYPDYLISKNNKVINN